MTVRWMAAKLMTKDTIIDIGGRDARYYNSIYGKKIIIVDTDIKVRLFKNQLNIITGIQSSLEDAIDKINSINADVVAINVNDIPIKELERVNKRIIYNNWIPGFSLNKLPGFLTNERGAIVWPNGYIDSNGLWELTKQYLVADVTWTEQTFLNEFKIVCTEINELNTLLQQKPIIVIEATI